MKFDDVPRLPRLPFFLGDIALLVVAGFIAAGHPHPFSPLPLLLITACVAIGCILSAVPLVVNYVRDQEEIAGALRRELSEQFKRLMAASEHLQHASAQLKTIEEIATKNVQAAEKLPYRLQEKIAEFNQQLAETEGEGREALEQELASLRSSESERLAAAATKIAQATAEWTKIEAGTRQQLAAAAQLEPKLAGVLAALDAKLTALDKKIAALEAAGKAATETAPAPAESAPVRAEPVAEAPAAGAEPAAAPAGGGANAEAVAAAPKPPRKPRPPKKLKLEEAAPAAPSTAGPEASERPAPDLIIEPVADEAPAPEDFSQVSPEENPPAATPTGDGRTRLTVVSYIGIGNKLYLRGEGPGLSWDKGVPLQFVSIGRWRWETGDATAPVTCKVYKNDKLEAPVGPITLAPGTEQEVTAAF